MVAALVVGAVLTPPDIFSQTILAGLLILLYERVRVDGVGVELRAAGRPGHLDLGMTLRLASFGVRGFVGQSLTPRVVMDFASAFGSFVEGQRVLLGRDTRYSSPMIHAAVTASLMGCGCEILDFGICPTPVLQFAVRRRGAAGAVSISGGHNGMGWNAMTLLV